MKYSKKIYWLLPVLIAALFSCTKTTNSSNNYGTGNPPFFISGLADITLVNDYNMYNSLSLSLVYQDSAQQEVNLSLSGLPQNINLDTGTTWSGVPTYSPTLALFDTLPAGTKPGTYPLTLTATTQAGKKYNYYFNLIVQPMPSQFLGKYSNCTYNSATGLVHFADSLYADANVQNKVWFSNFCNTGQAVYGLVSSSLSPPNFTVPAQAVGSVTDTGVGYVSTTQHAFIITVYNGTSNGGLTMR